MQNRLKAIGLSPINNVVDVTNYILHSLGQPLHAFDADKIQGKQVIVKTIPTGTKFMTLDGVERELHEEDLMICDAEKACGPVWAEENDHRITRIGRILRKLRIDELPQLFNVLKGEMSFVGPRPERQFFVKQLESQIPYYRERHTVRPGITGWAQVCYNYGATVEDAIEKLNYDLFYIKNMSTLMDVFIVLRTIKIVLFGRGAR